MVLLRRALPRNLFHIPPNHDPHELPRFYHLHTLPVHATTAPTKRIWISRFRPPRQRAVCLAKREICEHTRSHALDAFRLQFLYWCHTPLALYDIPQRQTPRSRRVQEEQIYESVFCYSRIRLSSFDFDDNCCYGESLLVRRPRRNLFCDMRVHVQ